MKSTLIRCLAWSAVVLAGLSPAARADGPVGRRYALLVGVNRYEHKDKLGQEDLKYAEGDAGKLAQALRAGGFADQDVVVMTTAREAGDRLSPRAENVRGQLKALAGKCAANDVILIAFAGYERQFPDTSDYFLCSTD